MSNFGSCLSYVPICGRRWIWNMSSWNMCRLRNLNRTHIGIGEIMAPSRPLVSW
ncbi:hypothetical protein MtrunA17_Chr3g0097161 [Medicago truncatula]|uniref:Uncharacterized protein n=1 Tax=Medicago truncatula TaxID=3880 RepID=A0A396INP5_MEDTR|nr:hypothetical protein MtrunA17_Chr3g0097161 [Medicago truncatula]